MKVLVHVELRGDAPSADTVALVSRAAAIADDVEVVALAPRTEALADALARSGARRVSTVAHGTTGVSVLEASVDALERVCRDEQPDAVFFAASVRATDVAAALAARLGAGLNWDLTDIRVVDGELRGTRPILGDSKLAEVGWKGEGPSLALFRPGAFARVDVPDAAPPEVRRLDVTPRDAWARVTVSEPTAPPDTGPRLDEAEVIVSGGRGIGAPEHLELIRELARALGGVAGVSMPVVTQGWAPYSMQVGQTGTIVRPRLYVACGISGQLQHRVGMERSGAIIAINTDPAAPIFSFCDVAVVGDLHAIIPRVLELLRARTAGADPA